MLLTKAIELTLGSKAVDTNVHELKGAEGLRMDVGRLLKPVLVG